MWSLQQGGRCGCTGYLSRIPPLCPGKNLLGILLGKMVLRSQYLLLMGLRSFHSRKKGFHSFHLEGKGHRSYPRGGLKEIHSQTPHWVGSYLLSRSQQGSQLRPRIERQRETLFASQPYMSPPAISKPYQLQCSKTIVELPKSIDSEMYHNSFPYSFYFVNLHEHKINRISLPTLDRTKATFLFSNIILIDSLYQHKGNYFIYLS